MRSLSTKRGFTLIELLVVIAIIAILASILFPVFAKAREKARQTTCLSQIRQIATAAQMFNQDNNGTLPGTSTSWDTALGGYLGNNPTMFTCPSDSTATVGGNFNSYGYNGELLTATGTGVNESVINSPTEVGLVCDSSPTQSYGNGGILGGGDLQPTSSAVIPMARHSNGTVVGYCDGHAAYAPNGYNPKDSSNAVVQSFFMCNALGQISNPVGGLGQINSAGTFGTCQNTIITIGGDMATMPIITAAAQAWKPMGGGAYTSRGFLGSGETISGATSVVWGYADGQYNSANTNEVPLGKDALVFIVSKNTKIPTTYFGDGAGNGVQVNGSYAASTAMIQELFTGNVPGGGGTGYSANVFQAYGYDALNAAGNGPALNSHNVTNNGNSSFLYSTEKMYVGSQAVLATDDLNMVSLVAADPYGIGFCSSAMADPNQVQILGIYQPSLGVTSANPSFYPQTNPKYRWIIPATSSGLSIPSNFVRTLYATCDANGLAASSTYGGAATAPAFIDNMLASPAGVPCVGLAAIQSGPLFQASYFAN